MLQLVDYYEESDITTLVFPYLSGDHLPVTPRHIQSYMRQLLQALSELWERDVVHCNTKKGNIIFDDINTLTVIDFESAVRRHELLDQCKFVSPDCDELPEYTGNSHHVAPEVLQQQAGCNELGYTLYGRRRDMYSAGVIMAELLLHIPHLFSGTRDQRLSERLKLDAGFQRHRIYPIEALREHGVLMKNEFNKLGADMVAKMIIWDRFERIRPKHALLHPFFKWKAIDDGACLYGNPPLRIAFVATSTCVIPSVTSSMHARLLILTIVCWIVRRSANQLTSSKWDALWLLTVMIAPVRAH